MGIRRTVGNAWPLWNLERLYHKGVRPDLNTEAQGQVGPRAVAVEGPVQMTERGQ